MRMLLRLVLPHHLLLLLHLRLCLCLHSGPCLLQLDHCAMHGY
jgi:hypothetical protein